jgi:hypothetical protein
MTTYPTKWKRTTMRGCGPTCVHKELYVESRQTGQGKVETRHVAPKGSTVPWVERCK